MISDKGRLKHINVDNVDRGLRARKTYEDIDELLDSIQKKGLIQPIAVLDKDKVTDWTGIDEEGLNEEKDYLLLAGGRRTVAHIQGGIETIAARVYGDITTHEMKAIELEENMQRVDLSWQEEVDLKDRIHTLYTRIHGKPTKGPSTNGDSGHKVSDTAEMFDESRTTTTEDINLAKAMKKMDTLEGLDQAQKDKLKNAKTKTEARKELRKMKKDIEAQQKADKVQQKRSETPLDKQRKELINNYIVGADTGNPLTSGFFEKAHKIPDGTMDLVEIDPPYGIDLEDIKKTDKINLAEYEDVEAEIYLQFMKQVFEISYRKMKKHGWLVCWFGPDPWFQPLLHLLKETGFELKGLPGIWNKSHGQTRRPDMYLGNSYEMFFYARKGKKKIIDQGRSNVYTFPKINPAKKRHTTERPIEMIQSVLETFSEPGSRVLVPFAGSGNTMLAASNMGSTPLGYDLRDKFRNDYILEVEQGRPGNYKSYGE